MPDRPLALSCWLHPYMTDDQKCIVVIKLETIIGSNKFQILCETSNLIGLAVEVLDRKICNYWKR